MARSRRVDYPGAWHHVMHRGARRTQIFADDEDGVMFLDVVEETVRRWPLEVHAYSLMPNHYHLLVRSSSGELSRAMRHLDGVYTQRFNRRHGIDGALFRGRFASQLVEEEGYLRYLYAYIHLNPVRACLVQRPDDYAWTSHRALVGLEPAPAWLSLDWIPELFGSGPALHDFVREVHLGREEWPEQLDLDQGWFIGAVAEPGEASVRVPPPMPTGAGASLPEDTLRRVARLTGTSVGELRTPRRGRRANPARRFAVLILARWRDLRHRDIAEILEMSTRQVTSLLQRMRRRALDEPLATWRRRWDALHEEPTRTGASDV